MVVASAIRRRWSLDRLNPARVNLFATAFDLCFKQMKSLSKEQRAALKEEVTWRLDSVETDSSSSQDTETHLPPAKKSALGLLLGPKDEQEEFGNEWDCYMAYKNVSRDSDSLL